MQYPPPLAKLIALLKRFPGVGSKSAERYAFQMITWDEVLLQEMGRAISQIKKELLFCKSCGALMESALCTLCDPHERDTRRLCIVSSFKDIYPIEQTGEYHGLYHILGGVISPLHGKDVPPEKIHLLDRRILEHKVEEVIIALDPTLEGDATALYIKQAIAHHKDVKISRLALGIPMGSSLDYIDPGTLAFAFSGRNKY